MRLLRVSNNNLTNERDQLQTSNNNLAEQRNQLQTSYNNLAEERDQFRRRLEELNRERSELQKKLLDHGWIRYGTSLYYISTLQKSWEESSDDCQGRGSDLMIINSKEEQEFARRLRKRLWIGLTDRDTEKKWKWVDGTPLSTRFTLFIALLYGDQHLFNCIHSLCIEYLQYCGECSCPC
ncbi:CD209 antigen-like protein E isoform X4 [Xyrichtys novacula]|uniref:CD209 antigen-like protein E isoform X4 n=1 Tax=Xyrichtys novacula TaxID=13765 RepID=A0AAV1EYC8_XYRNO|nr:CD209 antigen-like protein E isoform X4 [Xyrichtys novacula]